MIASMITTATTTTTTTTITNILQLDFIQCLLIRMFLF
jgi:hypothetical protein